jgi:hypothetical protein
MSKTTVGLFQNPSVANQVVQDLDASAFPRNEVRILGEPREMPGDGTMSTPRLDFEVGLNRELRQSGQPATRPTLTSRECGVGASLFSQPEPARKSTRRLRS